MILEGFLCEYARNVRYDSAGWAWCFVSSSDREIKVFASVSNDSSVFHRSKVQACCSVVFMWCLMREAL